MTGALFPDAVGRCQLARRLVVSDGRVERVQRLAARPAASVDGRDDAASVGLVHTDETSAGEHVSGEAPKEAHT